MADLTRQLECLNCSNERNFIFHTADGEQSITQADVAVLPSRAVLRCGRCGSTSVITGWGDTFPYRAPETVTHRRRQPRKAAASRPSHAHPAPSAAP